MWYETNWGITSYTTHRLYCHILVLHKVGDRHILSRELQDGDTYWTTKHTSTVWHLLVQLPNSFPLHCLGSIWMYNTSAQLSHWLAWETHSKRETLDRSSASTPLHPMVSYIHIDSLSVSRGSSLLPRPSPHRVRTWPEGESENETRGGWKIKHYVMHIIADARGRSRDTFYLL